MALASHNVAVLICVLFQLCLQHAQASHIAAFTNAGFDAPQVVMYDSASDSILYSLCNSYSTPVFPGDKSAAFELPPEFAPLPGTHLSIIGYADSNGTIQTQLFYQTTDSHIVEALFQCDDTGHYLPAKNGDGGWAFKLTDSPDIDKPKGPTDITALLLGEEGGNRVHYKNENDTISTIKYKRKEKDTWTNSGESEGFRSVGNLAVGFAVTDRITVVTPSASLEQNMFVSTLLSDDEGVWAIDGVPVPIHAANRSDSGNIVPIQSNMTDDEFDFTYDAADPKWSFEALDPLNAPLGLTFGSRETMSIFYVGKDKLLRQVRREYDGDEFKWSNATRPIATAWPPADDINAHLGVAYNAQADRIWIYYMSNKTMTQLYQPKGGQWRDFVALPKFNATADKSNDDSGAGGGLSKGGKLGVGIGVGLGVPLLLAAVATYLFFHSRSSRRNRAAENAALQEAHAAAVAPPSHPGSPAPRYTSGLWTAPGSQQAAPHDGYWPQQHPPGVPYSDQNGYIKPEGFYGWSHGGDQKQQQQQQQQQFAAGYMPSSSPLLPHHSPPAQTQPVFEMGNNQVPVQPQEMSGETTVSQPQTVPSPQPK